VTLSADMSLVCCIALLAVTAPLAQGHLLKTDIAPHVRSGPCRRTRLAMAEEPLYCLNVQLCIKAERRKEFFECIEANRAGTLDTEPLAVTYLFGEDESTPNTYHFFEQYRGVEGFEAHTQAPHFKAWEAFAATDPFTADPIVSFYTEDCPGEPGPAAAQRGTPLYSLNVALHVEPSRRSEFLAALRADRIGALAEPNCATYLFGEDVNAPNIFHLFEQYVGREGFEKHVATPHYAAWSEFKATEPFSEPATVSFYETIPGPSSATPAELEPFGPPPAGFVWGPLF